MSQTGNRNNDGWDNLEIGEEIGKKVRKKLKGRRQNRLDDEEDDDVDLGPEDVRDFFSSEEE